MIIGTQNCKGLQLDRSKTDCLKILLDKEKIDILFLQETHVDTLKLGKHIENKLDGKMFWSFGASNARGVGIYLSKFLEFHVHKFITDPFGRFLIVDATIEGHDFRIINIYAPNYPSERKTFYVNIYPYFVTNRSIIFGGDLNCVKNTTIDKINGDPNGGQIGWSELSVLIKDNKLSDVYRHKFPLKRTVSWSNGKIGCLLDRIFISSNLVDNIEEVKFLPTTFSDHNLFKCKLSPISVKIKPGRGYWKFNNSLLKDENFVGKIKARIFVACDDLDVNIDPTVWWDDLKLSFKALAIQHSTYLAKENNRMYSALTAQYILAEKLGNLENMQRVKNKLKELDLKRLNGSIIRSRIAILDNKEQPSTFFYRKELSKGRKKIISKIVKDDNIVCDDNDSISRSFVEFYSKLYRKEPVNLPPDAYIENLPKIDPVFTNYMGDPIDSEDICTALKQMENNKSPGPDGLTKEFYETFSKELIPILRIIFSAIFDRGSLSKSQKTSYISLICKNVNEPELCKNYRPISLLNVDYKILTKALCNRLRLCLSDIIHPDQTCSVPGRSIFDNCHLIRDIINDINNTDTEDFGILLSTDQEKAFDRVDHSYLLYILKQYGFDDNFIRWISILYNDISSAVIVNGHISDFFPIERSVRQGCSLSPLLYIMCLEPVLQAIRNDPVIKGVQVPGSKTPSKLTAYADDCKFFLKSQPSAVRVFHHFNCFGKFSGAKLSINKSEAMFLGKWRLRLDTPLKINWVKQMTIFGVKFGDVTEDDIWHTVYLKIEKVLNLFKTRILSIYGKAKLINTMVLSKLWHIATVVPMSRHYERLITKLVFAFIWGKIESVNRKTLYLPCDMGGIGLTNISLKAQSLILNQLLKVYNDKDCSWINYGHTYLGLTFRRFTGYDFQNNRPHCLENPPLFYKTCLNYIKNILKRDPNFVFKPGLSSKLFYTLLLKLENVKPHCTGTFPTIDFKTVFTNLCHKIIDPVTINISFKLAHDIAPVAYRLYIWNFKNVIRYCKNCPPTYIDETVYHAFWECPTIQPAKTWLQKVLKSLCDITLTSDIVRFGNFSKNVSRKDLAMFFLTEYRYSVWISRCRVRIHNTKPSAEIVKNAFLSRVNNRIILDHTRLDRTKFNNQWILPGLARFNQRGNLLVLLSSIDNL